MARRLLNRLREDQRGFTLTEQLVVAGGLAVILAAILGLSDVATKMAPQDRERVHALGEAQVGLDRMTRELRTAHAITIEPFRAQAAILRGGATITVTYDCSAAPAEGLRRCVRSQTGGTATAPTTVIDRVANANTRPVFTATTRPDAAGVPRTTYVRALIEVPSRGERKVGGRARIVLDDGFFLRNADALL